MKPSGQPLEQIFYKCFVSESFPFVCLFIDHSYFNIIFCKWLIGARTARNIYLGLYQIQGRPGQYEGLLYERFVIYTHQLVYFILCPADIYVLFIEKLQFYLLLLTYSHAVILYREIYFVFYYIRTYIIYKIMSKRCNVKSQ